MLRVLVLAMFVVCGLLATDAFAQGAPTVIVKVNKSPRGQGQIISYDLEKETVVVALRLPSGKFEQVEVSRHYVSPRAWRSLKEIARATREAADKSLNEEPVFVEVQKMPGGKGNIISFNADTNAVVVDFNGKRGREIPVSQLKPRTWQAAKALIGRSIPQTGNKPKSESESKKKAT